MIDAKLCISHILSCRNFDGAFGSVTSAESHAAQVLQFIFQGLLLRWDSRSS